MHEFGAAKKIMDLLEKEKPKKATIILGKMVSSKDVFLEILNEHIKGTELGNIELDVREVPVFAKCKCGFEGNIEVLSHVHFVRCPKCGEIAEVVTGNELDIETR